MPRKLLEIWNWMPKLSSSILSADWTMKCEARRLVNMSECQCIMTILDCVLCRCCRASESTWLDERYFGIYGCCINDKRDGPKPTASELWIRHTVLLVKCRGVLYRFHVNLNSVLSTMYMCTFYYFSCFNAIDEIFRRNVLKKTPAI